MKEELLHFVWRYCYFDVSGLKTVDGRSVRVIHPGFVNEDAGPDFGMAQIVIGNEQWHGQVEVHIKSSDWHRHRHSDDRAYDNVVLHVVYEHDRTIRYRDGTVVPTLSLADKIPFHILRNYALYQGRVGWIPCTGQLKKMDAIKVMGWMERLAIERLEAKIERIDRLFVQNGNDWDSCFYQWLAYGFGLRVNAEQFMELSRRVDHRLIAKYRDSPLRIEALFYGVAGLLHADFLDSYPKSLYKEFSFLKAKHGLDKMTQIHWKFHRMRPQGLPTIRLSQFVRFVTRHNPLLSILLECEYMESVFELFDVEAHEYWFDHSKFDRKTKYSTKRMGHGFKNQLLINVIVPFVFYYGIKTGSASYKARALDWLQQLQAERNKLIGNWLDEGISVQHAADSQALYHLKTQYCDKKRCLECSFGHQLMNTG